MIEGDYNKCRYCKKSIAEGRTYCSRECQTKSGNQLHRAWDRQDRVEAGGLAKLHAELLDEKRRVDSLTAENASLRERVGTLEGQVFEHDLMIRELTRTLRAIERKTNEGERWKGGVG